MNVISVKTLRDFWAINQEAEKSLKSWFHYVKAASWNDPAELKSQFGNASIVGSERAVFNIHGNKYRLVVRINYFSGTVFVRFVGTHQEYDQIDVETI